MPYKFSFAIQQIGENKSKNRLKKGPLARANQRRLAFQRRKDRSVHFLGRSHRCKTLEWFTVASDQKLREGAI